MPLSPLTSHYVRRLVTQNRDRLKFVVAPNAGLKVHSLADINAVLSSLYLDEDLLFERMARLEDLVKLHQMLREQGSMYEQYQSPIEEEILWILGFKTLNQSHGQTASMGET